jgi:hypothetical protein
MVACTALTHRLTHYTTKPDVSLKLLQVTVTVTEEQEGNGLLLQAYSSSFHT